MGDTPSLATLDHWAAALDGIADALRPVVHGRPDPGVDVAGLAVEAGRLADEIRAAAQRLQIEAPARGR